MYETVFGDCKQISAHTEVLKWNQRRKKRKIGKGATKVGRICCAYMWDGENWSECAEGYFIEMDISGMELIANICKSNFLGRNMAKEVNWKSLICVWENSRCASKKVVYEFYVTKTRDEKWDICIYERHKRKRTTFGSESKQSVKCVWNLKHKRNGKQVWIQSQQRFRLKRLFCIESK